jgi:hypothetical protein
MRTLADNVLSYLRRYAPEPLSFWTIERSTARPDMLSLCDTLYSLKLIGGMDILAHDAGSRFAALLSGYTLAGAIGRGTGPQLNVHKTAYALGVLNLLAAHGQAVQREALREAGWQKYKLLDRRHQPRWPWYFTHHAWRVGHWIGGIPAIVQSLWRLTPDLAAQNQLPSPSVVLHSSDALIDQETGLFRTYKIEPFQQAFRALYRFRHDPDAGDLGGIAHLHWGNYAAGRLPYKAAPALFDRTWSFLQRRPFMETVPYCLDFDIIHLARTAIPVGDNRIVPLRIRARDYAEDINRFYDWGLDHNYSLHKLPGGLATLHECALTAEMASVPGLYVAPVDVAREACWI